MREGGGVLENKKKVDINYYNTEEYAQKIAEIKQKSEEIKEKKAEEAVEKKKLIKREKKRLSQIFTAERCGAENVHFVEALIDRASWLRIEIEYIEEALRREGLMDFFVQGTQTLWREHPLSKMHVQHSKSYRETIKQLEGYGKNDAGAPKDDENQLIDLFQRGNRAREKYKQ